MELHNSSGGLGGRPGEAQRPHNSSGALGGRPGGSQNYATVAGGLGSRRVRLHVVVGGSGAVW